MEDKMSLMDNMAGTKKSNPDEDQKILDMYHELDDKGKAEITAKLEEMCGYYDEEGGDGESDESKDKGLTIVIGTEKPKGK